MSRARALMGWLTRPEVVAVVVALLPIVAAVGRALRSDWVPIGDDALVEIRSRDVFSAEHFPLLGTWSSASLSAGIDLNHPGPLLFVLLAPFVAVFGGPAGVAIGIGVLNAAAIVGCAMVGYRALGRTGSLAATLVAGALAWTLGSVLLTDPWNPHPLVLPCLLMLLLTWDVAQGDLAALPWLVAVGSLCLQVHLGYAYLVPAMLLLAAVAAGFDLRRRWRLDDSGHAADKVLVRRTALWAVLVGLVLWSAPIAEQLFGAGKGNLARILGSTGSEGATIGLPLAGRLVAAVVVLPPWWGRASFVDTIPYTQYGPDGATLLPVDVVAARWAMVAIALLFAVLAGLGLVAWRARDRARLAVLVVAAVAVAVAIGSLAVSPIGPLGLTPHQMRWLWSIAAFVGFAVLVNVIRLVQRSKWIDRALVAAVAVVAALNLPYHLQLAGPAQFVDQQPTARQLSLAMASYYPTGSVRVIASDLRFTESYSTVVMSALQRDGVDVRVVEPGLIRQLGPARAGDGGEAAELRLAEGRAALDQRPGADRIVLAGPLSSTEIDELLELEDDLLAGLEMGDVTVEMTDVGAALVANGTLGIDTSTMDDLLGSPAELVRSDVLSSLLVAGGIVVVGDASIDVERFAELRSRLGVTTVAVYAYPLTNG